MDFAENDDQALLEHKHFHRGKQKTFASQTKTGLIEELEDLKKHPSRDQAYVVYLWSLARTDARGEVFLLPANARPDEPMTWVSLTDVLMWVEDCPATNNLLILHIARPVAT